MIKKFRNSLFGKSMSIFMLMVFMLDILPTNIAYGLTGGPAQPEFNAFTPIGTSDMVDLASGDFSYNIPLMDVGGFPINLAYSSGVTMDQEASWVGLGWNLSIGQINRQMRGIPDDFDGSKGDKLIYENNIKDNFSIGGSFSVSPAILGAEITNALGAVTPGKEIGSYSIGMSADYNSFSGFSFSPSAGVSFKLAGIGSVGINAQSTPNGLSLQPSLSLHAKWGRGKKSDNQLGGTIGLSFNSRQGLSNLNMSTSFQSNKMGDGKSGGIDRSGVGSSISFVPNHYTPTVEDAMHTSGYTFNGSLGTEVFGGEGDYKVTGYISNQSLLNNVKTEQAFGYENTHLATDQDVLDFNREKDGNFSVNTTNLPLTNYTYDIYSVQGHGVGGMFRPFRSQMGFVADNKTVSTGNSSTLGIEVGLGSAVHVGADLEGTNTTAVSGVWDESNHALMKFKSTGSTDPLYEEVYFKNVGDLAVDGEAPLIFDGGGSYPGLGSYDPVKLDIAGAPYKRQLSNVYRIKQADPDPDNYGSSTIGSSSDVKRTQRQKRNQNIQKITVDEASNGSTELLGFNLNEAASAHHTAGYIITRSDGARYVYGEALYNTTKSEVTFAIGDKVGQLIGGNSGNVGDCSKGLVNYQPGSDNSITNDRGDKYFNRITTPRYAHTYLLTTLLSTDYSDVDDIEGPSVNDLGSYTLFEYTHPEATPSVPYPQYRWRVPFAKDMANYNEGLKTDPKDDKASYVYGVKEIRYISKIETKTHVAIFEISERRDAHGVLGQNGGRDDNMNMYKLDKIHLYSRGEYYLENGVSLASNPTPIKTVHFVYDYSLCKNIINNDEDIQHDDHVIDNNGKGKLTLKRVFFTYRHSNMGKYAPYEFTYGDINHDGMVTPEEEALRNPGYNLKGYDVWGTFKPNEVPLNSECTFLDPFLSNPEFMYTEQSNDKLDDYASSWSMTDVGLPSGGKIEIDYEADDYQYVQDKKAMEMFKLAGVGFDANPSAEATTIFEPDLNFSDQPVKEALLYKGANNEAAKYLYFELAEDDQDIMEGLVSEELQKDHFKRNYLLQILARQKGYVQFRSLVNVNPAGGKTYPVNHWQNKGEFDYVSGYFKLDYNGSTVFKHNDNGKWYGSVKMQLVQTADSGPTDTNPITKAGWHFGRKFLPKYIYGFPDQNEGMEPSAALESVIMTIDNIKEALLGANGALREKEVARRMIPEKSWIRLSSPSGYKKGGGCRVKEIGMSDEWDQMTQNEYGNAPNIDRQQIYSQVYEYVLIDENGKKSSSGVATYEPLGAKDNPLIQPVFSHENRLLAPDEENYMETPFGESFFPNPQVTYSRVEVRNKERYDDNNTTSNLADDQYVKTHATGKVVTEFYTSRDYPTIVDQTAAAIEEDHNPLIQSLLKVSVKKHITMSQGYVIHLNDMNGKMKSQRVYAEGQKEAISGVDYNYDVNSADVPVDPNDTPWPTMNDGKLNNTVTAIFPDGSVSPKRLGVEYDMINDFREKSSKTTVVGVNVNTATFIIGTVPVIVPLPVPDYATHSDKLNMSTTTKVINSFGILRETVAHDAGAKVHTRNLLWDASTGEVLLTETVNEYGRTEAGTEYGNKYYTLNFPAHWAYEGMGMACDNSGIRFKANISGGVYTPLGNTVGQMLQDGDECLLMNVSEQAVWIHQTDDIANTFRLINENGDFVNYGTVDLKLIRSGKRNIQSTQMASVVMMRNPLPMMGSQLSSAFLESTTWDHLRLVNAGAVEFSDDWPLQCECGIDNTADPINDYHHNKRGVWRALRSHLYLTGRHQSIQNDGEPDPRNDGFYNNFSPFYYLNGTKWEIHPDALAKWTHTSEVSEFSPFGFEIENKDALDRYSAAQYGYNYSFPLAVGANTKYSEIGFDGFEDYFFSGCPTNEHFGFRDVIIVLNKDSPNDNISDKRSHTGRYSLKVEAGSHVVRFYIIECQ